ncbi:uncharacterized protein HMPREF1541_09200 [Cyphellophora europaea CBS 101466]|uniref:Uncharacterized protein n=1 Tax=Cyphellophora europaea (strain CBS 101466) TaxID=1220924 RepID=W2SBT9_CYPE1|nr:uncharacterized protein HMPREF1541_09200 [Cyphellophora europaea CBS 101466]ETN45369.1 hypothetical protein HMPREF1541_09200 [Cyphellophora europaea CBS 101466]
MICQVYVSNYLSANNITIRRVSPSVAPILPQSKTSTSLASRLALRNPTPDRRLLRPIGPPLPHSYSTGSIPCFSDAATTPSPQKGPPVPRLTVPSSEDLEVSVADAIRESRMTNNEIELLKQVQREVVANQNRLRAKYSSPRYTSNERANDNTHNDRTDCPAREPGAVSPKIDTSLAKTEAGELVSKVQATTSKTSDGAADDRTFNPKHVYFEQDAAYWTGRYMTICDRLRGESLQFSLRSKSLSPTSSEGSSLESYESQDRKRMRTALFELRSFCKTEKARDSFAVFEKKLTQGCARSDIPSSTSSQSLTEPSDQVAIMQASARVRRNLARSHASGKDSYMTSTSETASFQWPKADVAMPNIFGRLALAKSKTTGNMAELTADSSGQREQAARSGIGRHDHRKSSTLSVSESIPPVIQEDTTEQPYHRPSHSIGARRHKRQSSNLSVVSTVGRSDEIAPGVTVSCIESGHPPVPPLPATKSLPAPQSYGVMVKGEKQRRSSGEVMKSFWYAGVDQVKKMGAGRERG